MQGSQLDPQHCPMGSGGGLDRAAAWTSCFSRSGDMRWCCCLNRSAFCCRVRADDLYFLGLPLTRRPSGCGGDGASSGSCSLLFSP